MDSANKIGTFSSSYEHVIDCWVLEVSQNNMKIEKIILDGSSHKVFYKKGALRINVCVSGEKMLVF